MLVVKLQSGSFVCQSVQNISNYEGLNFVNSDEDYDGDARVKDCNLWDDEW